MIWKQEIEGRDISDTMTFRWPEGAEILHVATQRETVCIWYRCDPSRPLEDRPIRFIGTGQEEPRHKPHIGTVMLLNGAFVLHLFDARKVSV